jgi:hypothetical protein
MTRRTAMLILDGIWGRPRRFRPSRRALEKTCGSAQVFAYDSNGCVPFEELGGRLATEDRAVPIICWRGGGWRE